KIPALHGAVRAGSNQAAAVGSDCQTANLAVMPQQEACILKRFRVPDMNRAILMAGNQPSIVWRKAEGEYPVVMSLQRPKQLTGLAIAEMNALHFDRCRR